MQAQSDWMITTFTGECATIMTYVPLPALSKGMGFNAEQAKAMIYKVYSFHYLAWSWAFIGWRNDWIAIIV